MDSKVYYVNTPLKDEDIEKYELGDMIYLTGYIYTLRDAGHKKLVELVKM